MIPIPEHRRENQNNFGAIAKHLGKTSYFAIVVFAKREIEVTTNLREIVSYVGAFGGAKLRVLREDFFTASFSRYFSHGPTDLAIKVTTTRNLKAAR